MFVDRSHTKYLCFLALIIPAGSVFAELVSEPVSTYVIMNPDGGSAVYVGGVKVGTENSFKISPRFQAYLDQFTKDSPGPGTTPGPSPKPKGPCGDIECPKPTPTPTPICTGLPTCPGGVPVFDLKSKTLIYKNLADAKFPELINFGDLPQPLQFEIKKVSISP